MTILIRNMGDFLLGSIFSLLLSCIIPSYQDPSYQDPSYQDPSYQDPSYQDPSYQDPSYQDPSYQDPSYQDPSYLYASLNAPPSISAYLIALDHFLDLL